MLHFSDGQPFTTGGAAFGYRAITGTGETPRLLLQVSIEGILTEAIVDTGAPYLVCNPYLAKHLRLDSAPSLHSVNLTIRGYCIRGELFRLALTLMADEGSDPEIETTPFVPALDESQIWELPTFLGMQGCLERVRFAIDPTKERFYFGTTE